MAGMGGCQRNARWPSRVALAVLGIGGARFAFRLQLRVSGGFWFCSIPSAHSLGGVGARASSTEIQEPDLVGGLRRAGAEPVAIAGGAKGAQELTASTAEHKFS